MSRSNGCACHCSSRYNVRKIRISDGRTVWRRLVTYDVVTDEIQAIVQTGTRTGGTFQLAFSGQTTVPIPDGASLATIQAALEALTTIGAGNVVLSGGPLVQSVFVYITFIGRLSGTDVPQITIVNGGGNYSIGYGGLTRPGSTVRHDRAGDCAYVDCACGHTGRLVVGIGPLNAARPFGLSSRNGKTFWTMPEPENQLIQPELDSNSDGQWLGAFRGTDAGGLATFAVLDSDKQSQWSRVTNRHWITGVFGAGTYELLETEESSVPYDFGRLTYGTASNGNVTYSSHGAYSEGHPGPIVDLFGVCEEKVMVRVRDNTSGTEFHSCGLIDMTTRLPVSLGASFTQFATTTPATDADWRRESGVPQMFYCATPRDGSVYNVATNSTDTSRPLGLLRISPTSGSWTYANAFRLLPTGSQPRKLWLCNDGVVFICGTTPMTINGQTCEIAKCDFDLNLLWTRRWRGVGAGRGLRGLSGDAHHVYISGDPAQWACD